VRARGKNSIGRPWDKVASGQKKKLEVVREKGRIKKGGNAWTDSTSVPDETEARGILTKEGKGSDATILS